MADDILNAPTGGDQPGAPPAETGGNPPSQGGDGSPPPANPTILGDETPPTENAPQQVPADWPADWKDKIAGGDDNLKKLVGRYGSPQNLAAALLEARQKISTMPKVVDLPENATPEQLSEYRKANGVPETVDGYKLPENLLLDEADKPGVKNFLTKMHAQNVPQGFIEKAIAAHFEDVTAARELQVANDMAYKQVSDTALRKEWGPSYTANLNAIKGMLALHPEEVTANLLGARLADGKLLASDPATLRTLLTMAKDINPAASLIPGGQESGAGIEQRIKDIETRMTKDRVGYFRDQTMQDEYGQLLTAREKLKAKG